MQGQVETDQSSQSEKQDAGGDLTPSFSGPILRSGPDLSVAMTPDVRVDGSHDRMRLLADHEILLRATCGKAGLACASSRLGIR
jgi:hypothetical protein